MIVVVSDLHIGDNRVDGNLSSLFGTIERLAAPDSHLVLNGDTFDLAVLPCFDSRHREFISVARKHGRITYIKGNHDWLVDGLDDALAPNTLFCHEFEETLGGRRFRFLHGHQSDFISNRLPRLNRIMIRANHWIADTLGIDLQMRLRATGIGQRTLERQENRIAENSPGAHVVVAGHTHRPGIRLVGGRMYVNTGDWMERRHCSYLLIRNDGTFELTTLEG